MTDTRNDQPSLALTELVPLNGASPSHGAADGDPGGIP
jgi:hypothetical protein